MDGLTKLATEIGHARDYGQMASAAARKLLDIVADLDAQRMAALSQQADEIWALVAKRYVELPKDADGEAWHIGDRTESGQTIEAMGLNKHGWHFVGTVNEIDPAIHRHYHAPTVEDVLREFALACEDAGNAGPEVSRLAAEYAKRLTLAEEVDQ